MAISPSSQSDRMSSAQYRALLLAQPALANGSVRTPKKVRKTEEEDLHRSCFDLVALMQARHPILRWMIHVPNGGKRPKGESGKLKGMGAKPGFPDLYLPRRCGDWTGFAVELKSSIGVASASQKEWLGALADEGCLTAICRDLDHFKGLLDAFLSGQRPASYLRHDQTRMQ